ncbi:nucleotidyltransferase domain-containing protein [Paenibacillus xanthanilyticus]|uniref:Nucleotidyltransferase family protein n=1 Tax=Paenibacillus xanthanilyticus TaxID=1783531 RepID=A0ABV8KAW2_9BACL
MDKQIALATHNFSNEIRLMLAILGGGGETSALPDECLSGIDWAQFLRMVKHHRVYPLVYTNLKKSGAEAVPEFVMQSLYEDYCRNIFQMMRLTAEMERIYKTLQTNGIRTIVLKGPILANALYGNISMRTSKDLDMLIPASDVERMEEILREQGYDPTHDAPQVLNTKKWKTHHLAYSHKESGIQIEVHWRLNPNTVKEPTFDELWERSNTSTLVSTPLHYLGDADLFQYLISHGARHGWFRLRWLCDIQSLLQREANWELTARMFRQYDAAHLGGQAVILANGLLGAPIPKGLRGLTTHPLALRLANDVLAFVRDIVNLSPKPETKEMAAKYRRYLFAMMSNRERGLYVMSQIYPSSWDAQALPLPKSLHFLYFPLRPFLWYWRKRKQQAGGQTQTG